MTEPDQIKTASHFMLRWVGIILTISFFLAAAFVYYAEKHDDYWTSFETLEAGPSIEIIP